VEQLLTTKLYIPHTRPELVSRLRLTEMLNDGLHRKLTLVSAPAGFGKTTLISEWVQAVCKSDPHVATAWLTLDDGDNDRVRFLTYFISTLDQAVGIETSIGKGSLSMLQSLQPPPIETILTPLINEIASIPNKILLVLDDYHLIATQPINKILSFLLENLPPQMHLVIATREDLNLPLARLRARGQLTEIRAADLRFTSSEVTEFLNQIMGLSLSVENIAALERRTEGWIAGLQLAAISIRGHDNVTSRIKSFTGSHRFVLDYLIAEVLEQQSEKVQTFLLQTSILNRLTGPLCDAVCFGNTETTTGQENSQATLEILERANLFIIPLDDERRWFRYHHLFAELLHQRLRLVLPKQLPMLHQRASEWYQRNGFAEDAIEHLLRANLFNRAANLLEKHIDATWRRGEHNKLRRWLIELPADLIFSRPHLCIFRAWYLFASGQQKEAESYLQVSEFAPKPITIPVTETDPNNQAQESSTNRLILRGRAAAIRAFMAGFMGDAPVIIQQARQALDYLPERDLTWRSTAAVALGDGYGIKGDMNAAYQARIEASKVCKDAGNIYFFMVANSKLAMTLREQGRLEETIKITRQQVQIANENGLSQSGVIGGIMAIWGEVLAELNDLEGAIHLAKNGTELTLPGGPLAALGWSHLCLLRVLFSCRDLQGMENLIQQVERIDRESNLPPWILKQVKAWETRLWLAYGNLEVASQWVVESGVTTDGKSSDQIPEINFFTLAEYIVLTRTLIAQERPDDAIRLLQKLFEKAETGGRTSRAIEILLLQALAFQAEGDKIRALNALERALNLAEPRGFYRIFVDEGPSMAPLLYEALERDIAIDYVKRLLQAFPIDESEQIDSTETQNAESGYIEPLSDREIEVLQLIAEGMSNAKIASRLVLSLGTVKTHARNIYGKLGVHNRTEAVARARVLGILPST